MTLEDLIVRLMQARSRLPADCKVFVLDRPQPEGLQITNPDGDEELEFLEISSELC